MVPLISAAYARGNANPIRQAKQVTYKDLLLKSDILHPYRLPQILALRSNFASDPRSSAKIRGKEVGFSAGRNLFCYISTTPG